MRKEETGHSRRRRDMPSPVRYEERKGSSMHDFQNVAQKKHDREVMRHKPHHRSRSEAFKRSTGHRGHHQQSASSRQEWRNRNSPVELARRHHTDGSSSSSSETDQDQGHSYTEHHKKREREESFEELSRRKRKIESELSALDAEEAAARQKDKKKKQQHTNHRYHNAHKKENSSDHQHREERLVHIKEEPRSDEEMPRRRRKPSGDERGQQQDSRSQEEGESGAWGRPEKKESKPKEKPNFQTSGKLAEDTNTYNGVVIKYNEPSEARKPKRKWRLYPFKGEVSLPFIPVHRQSAYLLGRTRLIADIPIDHPSCSKQHAVLQFRLLPYTREDGTTGRSVRPYVIDLESSNGTYVNNKRIEPRRYVELFEKDVLKFGFSTRVYVILHEDSKNEDENDEVGDS